MFHVPSRFFGSSELCTECAPLKVFLIITYVGSVCDWVLRVQTNVNNKEWLMAMGLRSTTKASDSTGPNTHELILL